MDIPSSPVRNNLLADLIDSDADLSLDANSKAESSIADDLIEYRKQKYQQSKNPMSSSPLKETAREKRKVRLRELAREKKINTYRQDMEQFVMKQEYSRHLKEMEQEAEFHSIAPDQIDRLIELSSFNSGDLKDILDMDSIGIPKNDISNEDDELIHMLEIQEEYETLMKQEQQELEEILSSFTIK